MGHIKWLLRLCVTHKAFNCLRSSCCFSATRVRNIGKLGAKIYFTDHRTANTIQLFVSMKRNLFGLFFFWTNFSQKIPRRLLDKWPSGLGAGFAGFPIRMFQVQNDWMASRSTQLFILSWSLKWVPGISGSLKSKLSPCSRSAAWR